MSKLCIGFYYNEMELLQKKVDYCKDNGLNLYVIDNMSTDGTYEWLVDNRVCCHRFNTEEIYHLPRLQAEMMRVLKDLQPEWVVYLDADLFIYADIPLCEVLDAEKEYNVLTYPRINFLQTKEERFRYYIYVNDVQVVFKYHEGAKYTGDHLYYPSKKLIKGEGIMVNYGGTKEHRLDELARRQLCWDRGYNKSHGYHLRENVKRDWLWEKEELIDIKGSEFERFID